MKNRPKTPRLSAGEMEIMHLLWRLGSATLSEAQAGFDRQIGYTTMQTRLNRLVEKGVVSRSSDRPARYAAAVAPAAVSASAPRFALGARQRRQRGAASGAPGPRSCAHVRRDRRVEGADCRSRVGGGGAQVGREAGQIHPTNEGSRAMNDFAHQLFPSLFLATLGLTLATLAVWSLLRYSRAISPRVHRLAWCAAAVGRLVVCQVADRSPVV